MQILLTYRLPIPQFKGSHCMKKIPSVNRIRIRRIRYILASWVKIPGDQNKTKNYFALKPKILIIKKIFALKPKILIIKKISLKKFLTSEWLSSFSIQIAKKFENSSHGSGLKKSVNLEQIIMTWTRIKFL